MMLVLNVYVGEPLDAVRRRTIAHAEKIDRGETVAPWCAIDFRNMTQFSNVFTPKRWELIEFLKASGPLTIDSLAKQLHRHYRYVHKDVTALVEWLVIEQDESGKVFVPWDEIEMHWPLLKAA